MSTPKAPSVLNSDVSLPLRPDTSAPSGDRLLSPNNDAGVPNKRTRTVSADNMEVELTTTSTTTTTTAPGPTQNINASLEASIYAHPLPASTIPPTNDKGKSVAFDVPARQHWSKSILSGTYRIPDMCIIYVIYVYDI
ncbi:hypothetical protein RhiirA4_462900 [Rhizophagus irregularis]|uniref:Uncharacterized protein n=1 Tax=Rhizophagus irregularis TaxID=588596 RepID=A0A2I1GLV8_9GLOM|nr:hypothetical protein RhiirA4_462900 [Rhizophagus irregularis]